MPSIHPTQRHGSLRATTSESKKKTHACRAAPCRSHTLPRHIAALLSHTQCCVGSFPTPFSNARSLLGVHVPSFMLRSPLRTLRASHYSAFATASGRRGQSGCMMKGHACKGSARTPCESLRLVISAMARITLCAQVRLSYEGGCGAHFGCHCRVYSPRVLLLRRCGADISPEDGGGPTS